jgi:hypothetical protein
MCKTNEDAKKSYLECKYQDNVIFKYSAEPKEMCCKDACVTTGEEKFYSIDTRHNNCGECCMRPEDYDLYKVFEPGLTPANGTVTPCADLNYHTYLETVTHGFMSIKMTLDLYGPDVASKN